MLDSDIDVTKEHYCFLNEPNQRVKLGKALVEAWKIGGGSTHGKRLLERMEKIWGKVP